MSVWPSLLVVASWIIPVGGDTAVPTPVLANLSSESGVVEVSRTAAPARLSLIPGHETDLFAYTGQFPGPTLELREGDRVRVRFRNGPPEATTIHWHGLHLPFEADGSAFHPIAPGQRHLYELTVRYADEPPVRAVELPDRLRPVPALDVADATATRVVTTTQGLLNNRRTDMHRIDETAALGATEIWDIENLVGMDHPFHLHGFQFQVLDRNGVAEPFRGWKDSVNVPRHRRSASSSAMTTTRANGCSTATS